MAYIGKTQIPPGHPLAQPQIIFGQKRPPSLSESAQDLDDVNRPETEADGIRAESIRRMQVRRLLQEQPGQTPDASSAPSNPKNSGSA